jgi:Ser/Thr protein kinase RdoA (MazF antagonist)
MSFSFLFDNGLYFRNIISNALLWQSKKQNPLCVKNMVEEYLQALDLKVRVVTPVVHEDAISSTVYKIDLQNRKTAILKICYSPDRYRRELYFLESLKTQFLVPSVFGKVEPSIELKGAILMECLSGDPLSESTLSSDMAFTMGHLLASLHLLGAKKYGDLSLGEGIPSDPIRELTLDFQESLVECKDILSASLLSQVEQYFATNLPLADRLDGPCIVHRDFKPGNIIAEKQKVLGVIDWENSRGSFAEEDFVRMDLLVWSHSEKSKQPFLEGYQSVRKLPNIEEMLPFLRIVRALGAIRIYRSQGNLEYKS